MSNAINPDAAPCLIRASAGTGKTYQLSNRFLRLLASGAPSDQLLASTFTRKAAGEILDRVLGRLADAVLQPKRRTELQTALDRPRLTSDDCREMLGEVVSGLHRVRVSTLDSFFSQIARTFSLELGLPPGWQIVEEQDDDRLQTEAIDALLRADDPSNLRTLVHLLTKGEARRGISDLVRSTVRSLYPLYQETTAAAWKSIDRPSRLGTAEFAELLEQLDALTLPTKRMNTARDADCERATSEDWNDCLQKGLANKVLVGTNEFYRKPIPPAAIALYQRLLAHAAAELVGRVIDQTEGTFKLLDRFHRHYQKLKQERRALRFDDITSKLAAAAGPGEVGVPRLGADPDNESLGNFHDVDHWSFRLDGGIEHLMLDEFQDTSIAQWQVIRPFARRVTRHAQRSFFCVGDTKQAIYGWRGGVAEIFDALPKELGELECRPLNRSYRSALPIVENVNRVFAGITRHTNLGHGETAVRHWCEAFPKHETARDLPGYACLVSSDDPGVNKAERQAFCFDRAAEIVEQISRDAPWASVGVLLRSNDAVAQVIYRLRARQIPASQEGGNPLSDSAAVQLIMSLLKLCDHPNDSVAHFHVQHSVLGAALGLGGTPRDAWVVTRAARRALVDEGYGPAIAGWAEQLSGQCDRRELIRLRQLVELAYGYQPRATLRTNDFLDLIGRQRIADPTSARVRVMTIHQSKGLEFDAVVLPQLDDDLQGQPDTVVVHRDEATGPITRVCRYTNEEVRRLLPDSVQQMFQHSTDRSIRESLCVLYVALTRAVHAVHMIIPPSRENEGKLRRSFDGLLRAALTNGAQVPTHAVLAETGDRDWHQEARSTEQPRETAVSPASPAPTGPLLLPPAAAASRELATTSPSQLEGGGRVQLERLLDASSSAAMARGTVIHAWFEQISWLDDELPTDSVLRHVARLALQQEIETRLNLEILLDDFRRMLQLPRVAAMLHRAAYPPTADLPADAKTAYRGFPPEILKLLAATPLELQVRNEQRFAVPHQGGLMTGSIDRLVLMTDRTQNRGKSTNGRDPNPPEKNRSGDADGGTWVAAEILDYKTDSLPADQPDALQQKLEFYTPQLQAYRTAVQTMTGLPTERISAGLLFVGHDEVHFL